MRPHARAITTLLATVLCTGPAARADDGALDVGVRVRAQRGKMTLDVAPDDTLRSGDDVELRVTTSARAYVYVVQIFGDGTSAVLAPDPDQDLVLDAHAEARVPTAPQEWFQLDDVTGVETVYVIAARQPIAKADQALAKELHEIRAVGAGATKSAAPSAPTPPRARPERMLAAGKRGLHKVVKADGAATVTATAASKDDGFVVATFAFKHVH